MLTADRVALAHGPSPQLLRGGAGPSLVYLHGLFGVRPDDPIAAALAGEFDVIAPVHPGFADLDELDDIRDVHDLALYYDSLLDQLGVDGAAVIGHSFGAMVAAELAAHVPARVARLMLVAPLGVWRDDEPAPDIFRAYPREIEPLLWSNGAAPDAAATDVETLLAMAQGMTAAGKFMWPLPDKGLERRLHRVKAATTVVWGSADRIVPRRYADAFLAGIPGATLSVVEGAGHMLPMERLDDLMALARHFFGQE